MTRLIRFVIKMFVLTMMLALSITSITAQDTSDVRFVHVIPDAVPVDVYLNGTLAVQDLNYGESSNYLTVPAGNYTITATAAGLSATLWEQGVSIGSGTVTFIASDVSNPQFAAFEDNLATTAFGISRLSLVHALAGGSAVSVQLAEPVMLGDTLQDAGTAIVPELGYLALPPSFDLPAQSYIVDVLAAGSSDALLSNVALALTSNTSYMAVVYGTATNPDVLLLSAPTIADADTGAVRFVHGIVGGPVVDIIVNDTLIVAGLTPDNPTEHIALPSGDHDVSIVVAGTEDVLFSDKLAVEAGTAQTVAALVVDDEVTIGTFTDDISGLDETTAGVSVLNTIDGASVTVELSDGTVLGTADAGEQSDATTLDAVASGTSFTLSIDGDEGTLTGQDVVLYGGNYYNIIVLDGSAFGAPSLLIASTSITQTLASAPDAGETTIVTNDPVATEAPVEEVAATEAPAVSQPVVAPDENTIVAEVALDPSANLNLRQFPNADALILGQAPSGAQLIVLGREGIPVALVEGNPPPPEAETYVDPVLDLGEGQDLDPTQTWVRVLYSTPDGGEVEAWTLSQFLIITDSEGFIDLRDLEPFPSNIAGETRNTDLTPPPPPEDIVTVEVINLNADASLNIRRSPDSDSEVLGQLPLGTVVELGGLLAGTTGLLLDAEWAFVTFAPAEGGVITGWVSTGFIDYFLNGELVNLVDLIDEGLVEEVTSDTVGEVNANVNPVTASTPDPQVDAYVAEIALDAGANLNLRRTPSVDGEVLAQIPSGTFVIVTARTADAQWLETSFEGEIGWIASQFVIVTFNGQFIGDLTEIPVDSTAPSGAAAETTQEP